MGSPINPTLLKFAAELYEFTETLYEKYSRDHPEFYEIWEPDIRLYSYDVLTAKFFEEGIEFYPEEK